MSHTCDRCRTQYDSGAFYGGHDYCATCYVRIVDEERHKKIEETRKQEQEKFIMEKRQEEMKQRSDDERRRKEAEDDRRRQEATQQQALEKQKQVREDKDFAKKAKHNWNISISTPPPVSQSEAASAGMPVAKKKLVPFHLPQPQSYMPGRRENLKHSELPQEQKRIDVRKEKVTVGLAVKKGLPVSLSCGQKNVKVALTAKNTTMKRLVLEFSVGIEDSKKKQIDPVLEPKQCTLEMNAEAELTATFDLKEDANTGPLVLTAQLRENAVYVDRASARSEPVVLTAQVKTPMDLQYVPGSAAFSEGADGILALVLCFKNNGESGGMLQPRSSAGYGMEGGMKRAPLAEKVKIKGGQKKIELAFSPAEKCEIGFLTVELVGVDANGKEFKLQKSFRENGGGEKPAARKAKKEKKKESGGEPAEGKGGKES